MSADDVSAEDMWAADLKPECRQVLDQVYEYLDGEAGALDCERIRVHLDDCAPCLDQYNLNEALKALVKRSCGCEVAPAELRRRIMVSLTEVRIELSR